MSNTPRDYAAFWVFMIGLAMLCAGLLMIMR